MERHSLQLPHAYKEQMKELLGPETDAFLASYGEPRTQGLRLNTAKLDSQDSPLAGRIKELLRLEPVPWCESGYYYPEEERPGRHPYHAAGLYYIQEPSAMSSAELLSPEPGETVLDLAAAPGGKATQLSAKLGPEGLLVANEIHPARAKILAENLERMGCMNAIAVNAAPDRLSARFPGFFDKIMLDAPCSGEGMFRKDPDAIGEWSPSHVEMCAARQLDIVEHAVRMLRPGGVLGYSTCTFNRSENEELLQAVTSRFPEMSVVKVERIWPHKQRGEGHFVAVLHKAGGKESPAPPAPRSGGKAPPKQVQEAWRLFQAFAEEALLELPLPAGEPLLFGEQLYWLPHGSGGRFTSAHLEGLKAPRPGLHLATVKKNRVEPAHALALALPARCFRAAADFSASSPEAEAYLRGEALPAPDLAHTGWLPVCVDGFALGWAKASSGQLKNHYPKGLRRP